MPSSDRELRAAAEAAFTVLDELWHDGYFPLAGEESDRIEEVMNKLREAL